VVKVSKPRQDMRFDVPVVGLRTVEVMSRCRVSALGMDAGRTLLFDRARVIDAADAAGIAIEHFRWRPFGVAERPADTGEAVIPLGANQNNRVRALLGAAPGKSPASPLSAREISAGIMPASNRELECAELAAL